MSSRISIARPQGSYSPDPHGFGNSRPSSGYRAADPDDPIEKLRTYSKLAEDNIEIYAQPLKPHLPAIGRFMIVVTFLEDALRIVTQWGDQLWYLQRYVRALRTRPRLVSRRASHSIFSRCKDTDTSPGESPTCSCSSTSS